MSKYRLTTDPYGHLEFCIGTGDDFYCFDYAINDDGTVHLHSTINSETGCFIMDGFEGDVPASAAVEHAQTLVDEACEWLEELEHDQDGWNQDPQYFVRAVTNAISDNPTAVQRIQS